MTEMSKPLALRPAEVRFLKKILSLDLDAIGLSRKDQVLAAGILTQLRGRDRAEKYVESMSKPVQIFGVDAYLKGITERQP